MNIRAAPRPPGTAREGDEVMSAMNCTPVCKAARRAGLSLCALAALLPAFAAPRAAERPLEDADVARWLPRLRAEAAAFSRRVREGTEASAAIESRIAELKQLYDDMASGKQDVLGWIRERTGHAAAPKGAVYSPECSRALTMEGGAPTAAFAFGKESPYRELLRRAAAGDEAARDAFHARRGEEETRERSAEEQAVRDFTAGLVSFYRERGFVDFDGPVLSILTTILVAPDRSVTVRISEANYRCGLLPGVLLPSCASLPTGPLLEIVWSGEDEADGASAAETAAGGAPGAPRFEADARGDARDDAEYERVKDALLLARIDADKLEQFEIPIPPDAPPEAKAELAAFAAELAVRKANALLYKRREAELAPVLEALLQLSE